MPLESEGRFNMEKHFYIIRPLGGWGLKKMKVKTILVLHISENLFLHDGTIMMSSSTLDLLNI